MGQNIKAAIFTTLATVFVALSTPAHAMSNGDLYQFCKPYADRAFKAEAANDLACIGYFKGTADAGSRTCDNLGRVVEIIDASDEVKANFLLLTSMEGIGEITEADMRAAIQDFINKMG